MNTEPITFKEQLKCLKKAAGILKCQRAYLREVDLWEIINGAWAIMEKQQTLRRLEAKGKQYALKKACFNAAKTFINRTYKLKTGSYRADLSFLYLSIYAPDGHAYDIPNNCKPAEETSTTADLFQYVMRVARDVLNVKEYRTLELYFLEGRTLQKVTEAMGQTSKGGTCMRVKGAIQKIKNELALTGETMGAL